MSSVMISRTRSGTLYCDEGIEMPDSMPTTTVAGEAIERDPGYEADDERQGHGDRALEAGW